MNKPPAFQFYADDFLAGVSDMTTEEVGQYILLLCYQWNRGSIPVQPERQQAIAKSPVSDYVIAKFKPDADGNLRNERLENERQKQAEYREKQRLKGIASGESRRTTVQPRLSNGSTNPPTGTPTGVEPEGNSPSPSPIGIYTEGAIELPNGFPKTEDEAKKHSSFVGCTPEFTATVYQAAVSRGGRDAKDVPIRSFRHHLAAAWAYDKNRKAEQQPKINGRLAPTQKPISHMTAKEKIAAAIG